MNTVAAAEIRHHRAKKKILNEGIGVAVKGKITLFFLGIRKHQRLPRIDLPVAEQRGIVLQDLVFADARPRRNAVQTVALGGNVDAGGNKDQQRLSGGNGIRGAPGRFPR